MSNWDPIGIFLKFMSNVFHDSLIDILFFFHIPIFFACCFPYFFHSHSFLQALLRELGQQLALLQRRSAACLLQRRQRARARAEGETWETMSDWLRMVNDGYPLVIKHSY
jgi:hypothetical protein